MKYLLLLLLTIPSIAETIQVPNDLPTITEAVASAMPGDTILIEPGIYKESDIYITVPDLNIVGAIDENGNPAVTIDGEDTAGILIAIGVVGSDRATIENIRFTGSIGNALWIYFKNPIIRNCIFSDMSGTWQGTAIWANRTEAQFESCKFLNNDAGLTGSIINLRGSTGGIRGVETGFPTFSDCIFDNNFCAQVVLNQFWNARFDQCVFKNNTSTTVIDTHQGFTFMYGNLLCNNTGIAIEGKWLDDGNNTFSDACSTSCPGDYNSNGTIDTFDLLGIISAFGSNNTSADTNNDGTVNVIDILTVISLLGHICV